MVGARISAVTGAEAHGSTGSTDCNIPLSMGVNAVCVGLIRGGHPHAREEYIERESLTSGFRLGMSILLGFFD